MLILTVALSCSDSQQGQDFWKVLRTLEGKSWEEASVTWKPPALFPSSTPSCCFGWILSKWLKYQLLFIVPVLSKGKRCALFIPSSLMEKILLVNSLLFLLLKWTMFFHSGAAFFFFYSNYIQNVKHLNCRYIVGLNLWYIFCKYIFINLYLHRLNLQ